MLGNEENTSADDVPGWSCTEMSEIGKSRAQELLGDTAPELVRLTDDVLFGQVWADPALSQRDRSLITVSVLAALGRTEQLRSHLRRAMDNGLSKDELATAMTHVAFYAGWPAGMTGVTELKKVTAE
jgi:4-carboxymuconolactone decarboxylase